MDLFKILNLSLQSLVLITALAAYFVKEARIRTIAWRCLLLACTALVIVVMGHTALNEARQDKAAANMDVGQVEFLMRLHNAFKNMSSIDLPLPAGSPLDSESGKVLSSARKSMAAAVEKEPQSFSIRMKEAILLGELNAPVKASLESLAKNKDPRAAQAIKVLEAFYVNKRLPKEELNATLAFLDDAFPRGWFRDVSHIEALKLAGNKKAADEALVRYQDSSTQLVWRLLIIMVVAAFAAVTGVIVLLTQLFLLPRSLSKDASHEEIKAPRDWGYDKVYGVFVGWLALECMISPFLVEVAKPLKALGLGPNNVAIITIVIYLLTNLPALLFAWFFVVKPSGENFFSATKVRLKTPRRGWFGLVMAGVLTWFASVPVVIVGSFLAKGIFNSQGSSNPILAVVMEAARNGDALTVVLFVIALGVLPGICEELLFRGFLYTFLRRRMGALLSMVISATVFAGVHLDKGAFLQLFILGFAFAFVFERTRSLIPCMVAHCMWNSGTFFLINAIFGS